MDPITFSLVAIATLSELIPFVHNTQANGSLHFVLIILQRVVEEKTQEQEQEHLYNVNNGTTYKSEKVVCFRSKEFAETKKSTKNINR
jgi:hypothetical protein